MIEAGAFSIAPEHPALPGHFPGNPVVPGVVLLDHVASLVLAAHASHRLAGLPQAKFLRPVRPGDRLTVHYEPTPPRIAFSCRLGADEALRGILMLAASP